jgi:hypothetical protein
MVEVQTWTPLKKIRMWQYFWPPFSVLSPLVALSSTNQIYHNVINIGRKLFAWENYNFDFDRLNHVTLSFDNRQTIMLLVNLKFHSQDKHIDIQYHFISEQVEMNEREFIYICITIMTMKFSMKSLRKWKRKHCYDLVGLRV